MSLQQTILAASGSPVLSTLVKATVAVALGLSAAALARRSRAAARHAVLAATFAVLLAAPLVAIVAPPLTIAMRLATPARQTPARVTGAPRSAALPAVARPPAAVAPRYTTNDVLLAVWIAGALVFLTPVLLGLRQVRALRRSAIPWLDAPPTGGVEVLLHEALAGPITCGNAVVLPMDAPGWPREDLERAIVHEVEHVRRRDWMVHCAARAVSALYWFHPLVWIARHRLELEAERACDDAVLAKSEATSYAEQLVRVAQRLSAARKSPLLAMASRADLPARVSAVLDGRQRRGRAGCWSIAAASVAAAVLIAALAPLRVVAAPQPGRAAGLPQLRTESALVMIDVAVTQPGGAIVEGLTAGDFTVTEDGAPQVIRVFDFQRDHYLLGYYARRSMAGGGFRKIDVGVKTATTATLNYRPGYTPTPLPEIAPVAGGEGLPPGVRPPVLLFKKEPEFSDEARTAKYQGSVILLVDIDPEGRVANARTLRSVGLGLDEKAIEAVRQWRFRAASKDGQPVAVQAQVQVSFRLM